MSLLSGFVWKAAAAALLAAAVAVSPARAQGGGWGNEPYGRYLEGFGQFPMLGFGVGMGPTTYGLGYGPFPVAPLGYGHGYGEGYDWRRGYPAYYGRRRFNPTPAPTSARLAAPYPTNQTYEPGDGYRYPLYYDPVGRTYIYYPVGR